MVGTRKTWGEQIAVFCDCRRNVFFTVLSVLCLNVFLVSLVARPAKVFAFTGGGISYYADPSQVKATLQYQLENQEQGLAHFKETTGAFSFDQASQSLSHLRIAMNPNKFVGAGSSSTRDFYYALETNLYPEITVTGLKAVSLKDNKGIVKGTLSLHGISKPVDFEASVQTSESGDLTLSVVGKIKMQDFALKTIAQDATLSIEMQAIKP